MQMVIWDYLGKFIEIGMSSAHCQSKKKFIRYPCISPRAEYCEAKVYSGTLASARFLYGDRTVVTVGGTDASLMVWELVEE